MISETHGKRSVSPPARKIRYSYAAIDMAGRTVRGTAIASDHDALYAQLREQELYLQYAAPLREKRGKQLSARHLAAFCQELSSLLGAGVDLIRALDMLSQEEELPREQAACYQKILAEMRRGGSLTAAMEAQGVFPDLMLGMIRAGEGNGSLDNVTARLASHYTREHKLRQQLRSALPYPCLLAMMALLALVCIFTFILPELKELFAGLEELPVLTAGLMAVSDFLVSRWYAVPGGAALLAVLVRGLLSVPSVRLWLDRRKLKTRFLGLGRLHSSVCTARFARTVSSLYSSGMPLDAALQMAGGTVGNRYLAGQFYAAAVRVSNGEALSASLRKVDGLQRKLCGAVQVGEETGQLDSMLDFTADAMEYDSEHACKRMVTLLEPVMIILMSVLIGIIMIGVMYPIISSYGAIESYGY